MKLLGSPRGVVKTLAFRVVAAVGEKLQGQERMGRPAFAQVDLDRVDLPLVLVAEHGDKIEREPADDAFFLEPMADFQRLAHDRRSVFWSRRELAPQVSLSARAAQHLVVR